MDNSKDRARYLEDLCKAMVAIQSTKAMKDFLVALLTPKELEEIPTRIQIVKLLRKGLPQHQIAKVLGIGVATVSRGARELKMGRFKNIK